MRQRVVFLQWALFASILFTLTVIGVHLGVIGWLRMVDRSNISIIISVICWMATLWFGKQYWHAVDAIGSHFTTDWSPSEALRHGRYAMEVCTKLGFIGTLLGFIGLLGVFQTLNSPDPQKMFGLMKMVGVNLGTSFVTTLAGTIAEMVIGLQCHWLETVTSRHAHHDD